MTCKPHHWLRWAQNKSPFFGHQAAHQSIQSKKHGPTFGPPWLWFLLQTFDAKEAANFRSLTWFSTSNDSENEFNNPVPLLRPPKCVDLQIDHGFWRVFNIKGMELLKTSSFAEGFDILKSCYISISFSIALISSLWGRCNGQVLW